MHATALVALALLLLTALQPTETAPLLSRIAAEDVCRQAWLDFAAHFRTEHETAFKAKKLVRGKLEMPFDYKVFGEKPAGGRSLFLSLHGGGNSGQAVNDQQWHNQMRLYRPAEGVYVCPRAPTNTWNMWHEAHMDDFFDELICCFILFEDVNPDRVYVMGYSAGGDGVYQLAPRMADRWAAASMMAGHPGDASPLGLRNLPFALHVGEHDDAYSRNKLAPEWKEKLDALQKADPDGYVHDVQIHPGRGHWMHLEDASAVPWMARYTRNAFPKKVVWKQDDVTHTRFYWLAVPPDQAKKEAEVVATVTGQTVAVTTKDVKKVFVRLSDHLLDLDRPVTVMANGREVFNSTVPRLRKVIQKTLEERGDPASVATAEVQVKID